MSETKITIIELCGSKSLNATEKYRDSRTIGCLAFCGGRGDDGEGRSSKAHKKVMG
jgi:hypothetical protein